MDATRPRDRRRHTSAVPTRMHERAERLLVRLPRRACVLGGVDARGVRSLPRASTAPVLLRTISWCIAGGVERRAGARIAAVKEGVPPPMAAAIEPRDRDIEI